jgi:hypothetical protein
VKTPEELRREHRALEMRAAFVRVKGEDFDAWLAEERETSRQQGWLEACRWGVGVRKQRGERT